VSTLEVTGVTKSYGERQVLRGIELVVPSGSVTSILGPSGSGKTTLLRAICGFERTEAGSITLGGDILDDGNKYVAPERRGIGYVPQDGSLFPHLTVARNIRFGLPRGATSKARAAELLELIGLADRAKSYPHQLSGGQQQRVALARALAISPRLVLLDEPFASLDASLRATVRGDVIRILRTAGATALLVTHDQDEALSLSDQIAVLRDGVIAQLGPPDVVYRAPVDADLAGFIGDLNLLDGVVEGDHVVTALGRLPKADPTVGRPGEQVVVLVRPEQLVLAGAAAADGTSASVVDQEFYGHDAIVRLSVGEIGLIARVRGGATWTAGTQTRVGVDGPVVIYSPGSRGSSLAQP
jgi:iron(III) transport system ATP-binding protein